MTSKEPKVGLDQSKDEAELSTLMRLAQSGDGVSYKLLLQRVHSMLGKYIEHSFVRFQCSGKSGQEDVLQEILLAIHLKRQTYDPAQFFLPWMYAIARYKVIDFFRKNKVLLKKSVPIGEELENIEALMVFETAHELDVVALCECLPEKQKIVLKLVKIDGLSIQEASAQTGFSMSDIKVTVHRAIKTLQDKVKGAAHEN